MKKLCLFALLVACSAYAGEQKDGYVITSDRMEGRKDGKVVVFSGNVKLVKDEVTVVSKRMESREGENILLATGDVHGVDKSKEGERTEMFCDKAIYDKDMSHGVFTGDPRVIRIDLEDESKTIDISGDKIEVFEDEENGIVKENVVVKQEDVCAMSKLLNYSSQMREIVLSEGSPRIYQNNEDLEAMYSAEKITMFMEDKIIIFEKDFRADIYIREETGSDGKQQTEE